MAKDVIHDKVKVAFVYVMPEDEWRAKALRT